MLIVLEGLDKTGKTTQSKLLDLKLKKNGYKSCIVKFPNRESDLGKLLDDILTKKKKIINPYSLHLMFSANRYEMLDDINKLLFNGNIVILDRYKYSGMCYSNAIYNLDMNWLEIIDKHLPDPDLIFYFKNSNNFINKSFGEELYEKKEIQIKVEKEFDRIFEDNNKCEIINIVNSTEEETCNKLYDKIISFV